MALFQGFHHIGLLCEDVEKSCEFYTKLGCVQTTEWPAGGGRIVMLDCGNGDTIELLPFGVKGDQKEARWAHLAFRTADATAAYRAAIEAGAVSKSEPKEGVFPTDPPMTVVNAWVYGPSGEEIEFFEVKK